jgi:hypothetical protein
MKSVKITTLLIAGAAAGLMLTGQVSAQGAPPLTNRDCARQMCFMLRNCTDGQVPESVDKTRKPNGAGSNLVEKSKSNKNTEQAQARPPGSCREYAYSEYYNCAMNGTEKTTPTNK